MHLARRDAALPTRIPLDPRPTDLVMTRTSAQNHVRIVSLLTLIGGILGLIPSLLMLLVALGVTTVGGFGGDPMAAMFAGGILSIIAILLVMVGLPAVIAGFGLLARKPWARGLTLVIAIINLFGFPIGTALGAYQLWVLGINEETVDAYRHPEAAGGMRDFAA